MKTYHYITASLTLLGFLFGSTPANLYAAPADEDTESVSATLLCGGAHRQFNDVDGGRGTGWSFRNYNDSGSIQIDHVRIYDGNGVLLYEDMPMTIVAPHSTVHFGSHFLEDLPTPIPTPKNPLQFILDWSSVSGNKVLTLDGYVIRTNVLPSSEPVGIFTFDCRTINVIKKEK